MLSRVVYDESLQKFLSAYLELDGNLLNLLPFVGSYDLQILMFFFS